MNDKWIPVSERLPEKTSYEDRYLVTAGNCVAIMYWNEVDKEWYDDFSVTCKDVRAWMELPDPYIARVIGHRKRGDSNEHRQSDGRGTEKKVLS